jgi:SWIM zinc finger
MQIDTVTNTITFKNGEKVTWGQLMSASNAVGTKPLGEVTMVFDEELADWEKDLLATPFVPRSFEIASFARNNVTYTVMEVRSGVWVCTCPDFTIRRYKTGTWCKHIVKAHYL